MNTNTHAERWNVWHVIIVGWRVLIVLLLLKALANA